MIVDANLGKKENLICKKCNLDLSFDEDIKTCPNCGYVVQEVQFETGNTFTDCKIDGVVYDLDEQQRDKSLSADQHIKDMVRSLKINSDYPDYLDLIGATPLRIIKFAYKGMFLDHGTNIMHYSAAALYIALRFYKAPFLLMDFSDKLAVNLFKLAKCYRKLAKFLNVTLKLNEKLPAIDPSLYIPRFCKELDFEDKADQVKATAIKLLKRMKLDWMAHGRRPSSLCGAAILIAGRMHGFNVTTSEVCQIVLVCEETLRKRLEEFKETEVASLTREKFDEIDIEKMQAERDPPAFIKNTQIQNKILALQNEKQPKALKSGGQYNNEQLKIYNQKLASEQENFDHLVEDFQTSLKSNHQGIKESEYKEVEKNLELVVQESKEHQLVEQQQYQLRKNKIQILEDKGDLNENESLSDLSDEDQFILTKEEQTIKSLIWYKMNEQWLQEQQSKIPKLALESKKDVKKRNKRRNDQLLNEDDPVFALMKSKNKKVKNNLDEKSLRELLQKSVMDVKQTQFSQVFENSQQFDKLGKLEDGSGIKRTSNILSIEQNRNNFTGKVQNKTAYTFTTQNDDWDYDNDYDLND